MLPDASHRLAHMMIGLSLIAVVYIGLVALVQTDMKRLIAYSSVSHMGFVTLGFFIFNSYGIEGALVQMISHGFVSAAMFLCVGVMYDRMHTRMISDYGGVVNTMPKFAALMRLSRSGCSRGRGSADGHLSAALHRRDARRGDRAAATHRAAEDMTAFTLLSHFRALPEILLLAGSCALMIVDLYVKDERRR